MSNGDTRTALDRLGDALQTLVPDAFRPAAKAVLPGTLTLIAVGVQWLSTGTFDRAELDTTIAGLGSAILTFVVSNAPRRRV